MTSLRAVRYADTRCPVLGGHTWTWMGSPTRTRMLLLGCYGPPTFCPVCCYEPPTHRPVPTGVPSGWYWDTPGPGWARRRGCGWCCLSSEACSGASSSGTAVARGACRCGRTGARPGSSPRSCCEEARVKSQMCQEPREEARVARATCVRSHLCEESGGEGYD
eukprot:3533956-Rhodomonas_salina.1